MHVQHRVAYSLIVYEIERKKLFFGYCLYNEKFYLLLRLMYYNLQFYYKYFDWNLIQTEANTSSYYLYTLITFQIIINIKISTNKCVDLNCIIATNKL